MKRIIATWFLLTLVTDPTIAQKVYKFSGVVQDSVNGDFVPFAQIFDTVTGRQVETDQYGRFSMMLKESTYDFTVFNIGYQTKYIRLNISQDLHQVIKLSNISLPELVILGSPSLKLENGYIDISPEKLKSVPTLLGEKDVLKALAILPGVAPGNDGTNQISVRGGGYDQNLVLLDGSVLYNTSHFFGFLSAIDPFAIKSLRFYKDGFPTDYGGRLSSVVDIKLKEGNLNKIESYINVGLMTSSVGINGPIKKEKLSFLLSSRIAYPGLITLPFRNSYQKGNRNNFVSYFMYDIVSKLSWKINDRHSMYLSGTTGKDFLLTGNQENNYRTDWNINWGNSVLAFRYNGIFSRKMDLTISANFNNYKYESTLQGIELSTKYKSNIINQSSIKDLKAGLNLNWNILPKVDLVTGASYTVSSLLPIIKFSDLVTDTSSSIQQSSSNEFALYQTLKIRFLRSIRLDMGYRYSHYSFKLDQFRFFQPRFLLSYQTPNKKIDFYASYSKMYQPVHLLLNASNGYVNEVWLAANKSLPPQRMNEITLGVHTNQRWGDIRLAYFTKKFEDLIELKDNIRFLKFFSNDWDNLYEKKGRGVARGIEGSYMHHLKNINFILAYTYNNSKRTFRNINQGNSFPSPVERPHVFSFNADYVKNERSTLTLGLTYLSGTPVTLPEYYVRAIQNLAYTERYNTRLPAYKRVDLGYKRTYTNSKGQTKEWTFSVYNLFLNKNVIQVIPSTRGIPSPDDPSIRSIGERPYFQGRSLFAFIPGINFYYKFR